MIRRMTIGKDQAGMTSRKKKILVKTEVEIDLDELEAEFRGLAEKGRPLLDDLIEKRDKLMQQHHNEIMLLNKTIVNVANEYSLPVNDPSGYYYEREYGGSAVYLPASMARFHHLGPELLDEISALDEYSGVQFDWIDEDCYGDWIASAC